VRYGGLDVETDDRLRQLRALAELRPLTRLGVTAGLELMERDAAFTGRAPRASHDDRPDAPFDPIRADIDDTRRAAFLETDWMLRDNVRAIVGMRADRGRRTGENTLDPRASLAYRIGTGLTLTAAWGIYHQVPAPQLHDPDFGGAELGSMRAEHRVVGLQAGEAADGGLLLRLEAYDKQYDDLAEFDRERRVRAGGTGHSRGVDVFIRWPARRGVSGRTSYSFVHARRTDPNSGTVARSPFDITHVVTSVIDWSVSPQFNVSIANRYATGRPFTPVASAQPDTSGQVWVPSYAAPLSERLPSFQRIDASLSRLVPLPRERLLVLFAAVNNIFDRKNVHDYRYNADYSERIPVRSQFKRSIYVGASITW
jgi:vitamin B12 transporter